MRSDDNQYVLLQQRLVGLVVDAHLKEEHGITLTTDGYHLLADHPNGFFHVFLDEQANQLAQAIASTSRGSAPPSWCSRTTAASARVSAGAFERVRGELARQGIELQ